jgi:hypothetical protein
VPAVTPEIEAVEAPLFQEKEYVGVPPVAEAVAPPFANPLHVTLLSITALEKSSVGSVIVMDAVSVQPFASVTVTVKVPAVSPVAEAVFCPLLQANE